MAKKSSAPSAAEKAGKDSSAGLPLFFRQPRALDAGRHAKASVSPTNSFAFACETNSIPLNTIEFIEAVKHYPIVFTGGDMPTPVAVVGLERGNYFVQADDSWKAGAYVPAYVRQYPFIFFEESRQKKFYLCIDESAPNYHPGAYEGATPLYTGEGKPSALTDHALKFCTAFYQHHVITRNFCADLKKYNLFVPYQSEARLASGKKLGLSGFQIISEKALNELPDKTFREFRKKGWLPFIYLVLASTSNWKRLADMAAVSLPDSKIA